MTAPSVEYGVLSPMLIVFVVAVAGVLVEAFLPRRSRYPAQLTLAVGGLLAAFAALVGVYQRDAHRPATATSVRPGGPRPSGRSRWIAPRCSCRAPCYWSPYSACC